MDVKVPKPNGKGIDVIEIQVENIIKNIMTQMDDMYNNGYKPEHLVIWEGYLSALGTYNQRYGVASDPFVHPEPIKIILGLNIVITKKENVVEVY